MRLMREVRFLLTGGGAADEAVLNPRAGWPGGSVIAPFVGLRATVSGPVDDRTGYTCSIASIDRLLRRRAVPCLQQAWARSHGQGLPAARSLAELWGLVEANCPANTRLETLELCCTPYQSHRTSRGELPMIVMTESFEFAASHRLYCRELDDRQNREIFGKCSNPNSHGHNYVVEVSVVGEPAPRTGTVVDHQAFQATVKERVIDRFDHKHLNVECGEFTELNPTVENIARVIWDLLADRFAPARLYSVRVYETPKTCAEYSGGH